MPLKPENLKLLMRAHGYVELGMYDDATEELDTLESETPGLPEIMAVRAEICRGRKQWREMQAIVKHLAGEDPGNPQWPISHAYATRRAESVEAAKPILLEAVERHPAEPILYYNLACYECQTGNLASARGYLEKAFELEPKCKAMAITDEDLQPLRAELRESFPE